MGAFLAVYWQVRDVSASPVSFKYGKGVMASYNDDRYDLQFNYSFSNSSALGVSDYYRRGEDHTAHFILGQYNYLIKRWNEMDSQGNIFLSTGIGGVSDTEEGGGVGGLTSLEANWETRRIYTMTSAERLQSTDGFGFTKARGRAGVAPYIAPFESLQTWLFMQIDYMPEMDETVTVTPVLRFFYNNVALEGGVSFEGKPFAAVMAHF